MIGGVLSMGRRMAESRMTDTCEVVRITRSTVPDESTGQYEDVETTIFAGLCRIKHPTTSARDVEAGSQLVVVSSLEAHLPVAASGVGPGDLLRVTGSATRAEMVGREFTISAPFDGSQTTALRFRIGVDDGR